MQSSQRENFFETDAAQADQERKAAKAENKHGNPISMKSKILAAIADPSSPSTSVFIAESAGYVRRVNLESSAVKSTYKGPRAPATCLAVGGTAGKTLFAGSWDKDIWAWDVESTQFQRKLCGHSDFVKTLVASSLPGKDILISGGADKKIIVWDTETGRRIHTLQDPSVTMLAVQHLAIDHVLSTPDKLVVVSASSDPHIRRWEVTLDGFRQLPESFHDKPDTERLTIHEHETSVYKLLFDDNDDAGDLWTASADGTAKCLTRARSFVADEVLEHGDYVRAVLVTGQWVITAGRDENVKVWDRSNGKLYCTLEGHYEEVTDLVLLPDTNGMPFRVCSVSIDRTIRTWPLAQTELDLVVKTIREPVKPKDEAENKDGGMMTAEEEAELAELMED